MKIIFLDVDGVLNSVNWYKRRIRVKSESLDHYHKQEFDPIAVTLIKNVIKVTGAKVVLSSTWRLDEDSRKAIRDQGIYFISYTPRLPRPIDTNFEYCERGKEIKAWLHQHEGKVEKYVIIDDDIDMLPEQIPYFFKTDNAIGLTQEIANEMIMYLRI